MIKSLIYLVCGWLVNLAVEGIEYVIRIVIFGFSQLHLTKCMNGARLQAKRNLARLVLGIGRPGVECMDLPDTSVNS